MNIIQLIIRIIRKNLVLFIVLIALSVVAGFIHESKQKTKYISKFTTSDGLVEYTTVQTYNDFVFPDSSRYDLTSEEIKEIKSQLEDFKISFIQDNAKSVAFTLVTDNEVADNVACQDAILKLMNNNKLLSESLEGTLAIKSKKVDFLSDKIAQLDSMVVHNENINNAPLDSYDLFSEMVDLEDELNRTGQFDLLFNVQAPIPQRRPAIMYCALYLVFGMFLFGALSKKEKMPTT